MFKPIKDILDYIKIFEIYLGAKIYIIYFITMVASFLEGFGILLLLPLLQNLDDSQEVDKMDGGINEMLYSFIEFLGFTDSILSILILICIAFILKGLITFCALGYNAFLTGKLLKEIKVKLFSLYSKMSYGYYTSKNTGDLINLINEQPTRALEAFKQLTLLGSHFINTITLMVLAFLMTFRFGLMALVLGVFLMILFMKMNSYVQSLSRITANENGLLTKWLIQAIHGFKYLVSTSQISLLNKKINNSISVLTLAQIKAGIAAAFTQSVREPIAVIFIMIIIYIQLFIFELRLEPILVSIALFYRALNSTLAVQSSFQGTFRYIGSMELVHNEYEKQQENQIKNGTVKLGSFSKNISLSNVSFRYLNADKDALNSITLNIKHKDSIAIVGESGSGKTTLVDLITLTNENQSGFMLIDGINVNQIKKETWREQIGYVSQDTLIFDDTIANNISMWNSNKETKKNLDNSIRNAAKQANILKFIDSLPNGTNTMVGDRGILLSGGQKQRLFIARELFRNPNLLILDEATSSLDSESEKSIQNSIESLKGKITVIVIAHRLSTIKNVDHIYLIEEGRIKEQGTFSDLKNDKDSRFSELASLQKL
jgi:ABC-type multidrug transport system fused ATPase/permease subunit